MTERQPLTPYSAPLGFSGALTASASIALQDQHYLIGYTLEGNGVQQLLLAPATDTPQRRDALWKHTCFEAFFGIAASRQYVEFNGSPSGDWALYAFDDYRVGMKDQPITDAPALQTFELSETRLLIQWKLPIFTDQPIEKVSITAVLLSQTHPDTPTYWALRHAGTKADFHLRDSFIYSLA